MSERIAIHLPVFMRKRCALMAYDTLERMREEFHELGYTTTVTVGGSCKFDRELCANYGHTFLMLPNNPVGNKFHLLARHIIKHEPFDWFMEFCSDNCVTPGYVAEVDKWMKRGRDMIFCDAFQTCSWDQYGGYWFEGGNSNVARMTRGDLIRKIYRKEGHIFDTRRDSRIDASLVRKVRQHGKGRGKGSSVVRIDWQKIWGWPPIVDVKDGHSMHSLHSYSKGGKKNVVPLTGNFPELDKHHPSCPQQPEK